MTYDNTFVYLMVFTGEVTLAISQTLITTMIIPLTDVQLKAIQNSCPRSQAEIDQDLAIVRHWLDKQPHLPKTSKYILTKSKSTKSLVLVQKTPYSIADKLYINSLK